MRIQRAERGNRLMTLLSSVMRFWSEKIEKIVCIGRVYDTLHSILSPWVSTRNSQCFRMRNLWSIYYLICLDRINFIILANARIHFLDWILHSVQNDGTLTLFKFKHLYKPFLDPCEDERILWDGCEKHFSAQRDIPLELIGEEAHDTIFPSKYCIRLMEEVEAPIGEIRRTDDGNWSIDEDDLCMDHPWIEPYSYSALTLRVDEWRSQNTMYTSHIRMPDAIRTIRKDHIDIDTGTTESPQLSDDLHIREISMFDDDRFLCTWEFIQDTFAHGETITKGHEYLDSCGECLFYFSPFFGTSSSCDSVCEFAGHLHHIVMPTTSIGRYQCGCSEVLIRDIHPSDEGMTRGSEFIEEKYLGVIIFSQVFESEWPSGSDRDELYIFRILYECLDRSGRKYISPYLPETPEFLSVVYPRTEGIFLDDDIYTWKESRLLMQCTKDHIPRSIIPPHIHTDTYRVQCFMNRHEYLHLRILSIDDESGCRIIPVFCFFRTHSRGL